MRRTICVTIVLCVACAAWGQGTTMIFEPTPGQTWTAETLTQAAKQLGDRLSQSGIRAKVSADEKALTVSLENALFAERVRRLARMSGELAFMRVAELDETAAVLRAVGDRFPGEFFPRLKRADDRVVVTPENVEAVEGILRKAEAEPGLLPAGKALKLQKAREPDKSRALHVIDAEPLLSGRIAQRALAGTEGQKLGDWRVYFVVAPDAADRVGEITLQNLGRRLAIVTDGQLLTAAVIRSRLGAKGTLAASFTREEATDLATAITMGPLPLQLVEAK